MPQSGLPLLCEQSDAYVEKKHGERAASKLAHPQPTVLLDKKRVGIARLRDRCCGDIHPTMFRFYDQDCVLLLVPFSQRDLDGVSRITRLLLFCWEPNAPSC